METIKKFINTKIAFAVLALCIFTTAVKGQSMDIHLPETLIMPDGTVVPSNRLDSIKKVFGGRDVQISFHDDKAYAHPMNNKAEQTEAERKLNAHLNQPAPNFAFKGMDGHLYSLAALKSKIVVLNFWFTQCGGCITEMPDLNQLKHNYPDKDIVFLAVTFDDSAKIKSFLAKNKFDYKILPSAKQMCTDYNIYGYPTSMVIDHSGVVKFINCSIEGDIKSELTRAIDQVKTDSYTLNK